MATFSSKTVTVSIECPPDVVAEYVRDPANLPKWARAFCQAVRQVEGKWVVETAGGDVELEFVAKNAFGVLDHSVRWGGGQEIEVAMRVVPNGSGSEVIFTLLRMPEVSDEQFANDVGMVERDLVSLQAILEKRAERS